MNKDDEKQKTKGLPNTISAEEGFGLLIQPFIDFDVSGVAFSNHYGTTVIESAFGDARSVVQGNYCNTVSYQFKKGEKEKEVVD